MNDHRTRREIHRRRSSPKHGRWAMAIAALSLVLIGSTPSSLAATPVGNQAMEPSTPSIGDAGSLEYHDGSLTVTEDGTVIEGLYVSGAINVRADDVIIRDTVVANSGWHSIRVSGDAEGTEIYDTTVYCENTRTNGVVFGDYYAENVSLFGCRNDFMSSTRSPAVVVDSFVDGAAYSHGTPSEGVRPGEGPSAPEPTPEPTSEPTSQPTQEPEPEPEPEPTQSPTTDPDTGSDGGGAPSEFPNASTTGVPSNVSLRSSGSITVTRDGTVIDGLHVRGTITVVADNVTIRNTLIEGGGNGYPIEVTDGATNTLVERVEIDNQGGGGIGILITGGATDTVVRSVDIHSAEDGIRIQADDVVIEYSYIHDLTRQAGGHHDCIQIRRGDDITLRYNNLQAYLPDQDDPLNAALQIGSLMDGDPISNLLVEGNLMNGGNFTINGGGRGEVDSARYTGNMFGRDFRYGIAGNMHNSVWESSNVWYDNRQPAD